MSFRVHRVIFFYDKLQKILIKSGFDAFVEALCAPQYAEYRGRPSIPPGRYFRMHLIGYFENINSERGIEWRCAESLSLREFLRLSIDERVGDTPALRKPQGHPERKATLVSAIAKHGRIGLFRASLLIFVGGVGPASQRP